MKKIVVQLILSFSLISLHACEKDNIQKEENNNVIVSAAPLIDFGSATYRGFQGGLYPNQSNQRPETHNSAGIAIAKAIKPLNNTGSIDNVNGKIVWMSIGMSNTTQETQAFLSLMKTYANKNPKLTLIDGAEGGKDIKQINNPTANYWNTVYNRLAKEGLTPAQVQVIWFKEAEAQPTDTSFATYPDALKIKYKSVMQILKTKFPNLKLCYLSNRIYGGYATNKLNPEPFAWYTGWAVKRLIADQISGDAALNYSGSNPSVAWMSWGPYLWANGATPRSDGLRWLPEDFQPDGTHPSTSGRQKVAEMLLQFFSTDETTKSWFLKP